MNRACLRLRDLEGAGATAQCACTVCIVGKKTVLMFGCFEKIDLVKIK